MADVRLQELYDAYRAAYLRSRPADAPDAALDALLRTRIALFEHLVRTGWQAPGIVRRQVRSDQRLLLLATEQEAIADRIAYLDEQAGPARLHALQPH